MKLPRYAVAVVVVLGFALIMLNYKEASIRRKEEMIDKINAAFLLIEKSDQLYDRIEEVYCPPKIRCVGQTYLVLSSGKKIRIMGHGYKEIARLVDLQRGDSIIKLNSSDTIWIRTPRQSERVFFLIKGEEN